MDAGGGLRLTAQQRQRLQAAANSNERRTRMRAMVVLLSASGQSAQGIAQVVGLNGRTVERTRQRWRKEGLAGLRDRPRPGRPPAADENYLRRMCQTVEKDPRELGYAFSQWTTPRLEEYLFQRTGIRVSPGWLATLLKREGFVWRRTKRTLRNLQDHRVTQRARRQLQRLKRGPSSARPTSNSGTATESSSSSCP